MDDLPTDYDAIIVGTGMIESVIAAALSRIGKSVLHLDSNDYYGDNWASFNLEGFENWTKNNYANNKDKEEKTPNEDFNSLLNENERIVIVNQKLNVWNAHLNHFVLNKRNVVCGVIKEESEKEIEEGVPDEEKTIEESSKPEEKLVKLSRRFNLDLCPKLLFSKGMLVQLLISSNIARYAEFKSVSRVVTWREGQLEPVPCSRSDVFATKNVTVVHKRILVKILTLFANYTENLDEFKGFEKKTLLEYLKHKKLPENLIHYILYAIAMGDDTTCCLDGVKNCKAFLESLGRYGNTPFIFPMYGAGELPQCFCRLCAVYGGVYCLQRGIEALVMKDDECVGVISNKKRLNARTVVLSSKHAPEGFSINENVDNISRGIFITDRSILQNDKESLTLLQFPPIAQVSNKSVTVIELGSESCTCPENYFVVHMTAKMSKDADSDLKHVAEALFETECEKKGSKPKVLWSGTWNVSKRTSKINDSFAKNVKVCCSVDSELDYDCSISEAKRIFKELYPEEEFLPRAPDPDEIVLDSEETPAEGSEVTEKRAEGSEVTEERAEGSEVTEERAEGSEVTEERAEGSEVTEKRAEGSEVTEKRAEDSEVTEKRAEDSEVTEKRAEDHEEATQPVITPEENTPECNNPEKSEEMQTCDKSVEENIHNSES